MPYKDPAKMAEYMRQRRAAKSGKVNVNPVNRKPVNQGRTSQVSGSYEDGYWMGICPVCILHNQMDPKRSFRPVEKCEHFQQLRIPGKPSEFIFNRPSKRLTHESVNTLTQNANPPKLTGTTSLSDFGILYRKNKDDFTLVYLTGDRIRPLRSLRTGLENGIPELSGLRIIRDKPKVKEADVG